MGTHPQQRSGAPASRRARLLLLGLVCGSFLAATHPGRARGEFGTPTNLATNLGGDEPDADIPIITSARASADSSLESGGSIRASQPLTCANGPCDQPAGLGLGALSGTVVGNAASALFAQAAKAVVFIEVIHSDRRDVGSGVILHRDGFIGTAAHVVEGGAKIVVEFIDGSRRIARIATFSRTEDLALLRVDGGLPASAGVAVLADSDLVASGQQVFCIGAPLGLKHTFTTGIISAIRTDFGSEFSMLPRHVIQTDASINQGTSGGALFNAAGEVVGLASFLRTKSGGSMGLGFAVPSNTVRKRLFDDAIPYFGLILRRIPPPLGRVLNWPYASSLLIEKVVPGSAGAKAGLRGGTISADFGEFKLLLGGDLIIEVNDIPLEADKKVHALLRQLRSGDRLTYTILRAGVLLDVEVVLEDVITIAALPPLPRANAAAAATNAPKAAP